MKTNEDIQISRRGTITALTFVALFAALISAGGFVAIPVPISPVPIALQNLFALLAGMILGPMLGGAAVALFIVAGAIGAPVFAGNTSGIARLLGPTGGYLFGYLLGAIVAGLILGFPRYGEKLPVWRIALAVVAGCLVVYVPGLIRLKMDLDTWARTFIVGFLPFLPGDAIKVVAAALIAPRLRRIAAQLLTR